MAITKLVETKKTVMSRRVSMYFEGGKHMPCPQNSIAICFKARQMACAAKLGKVVLPS